MAIKGKRKSQARGSQARRRPAAMPRPVATARRTPWYHTAWGRLGAALAAVLVVAGIFALVAKNRSEAQAREERRDQLENYTGELRSFIQTVRGPLAEMTAATVPQDEEAADKLEEDIADWTQQLQDGATELGALLPPEGLQPVQGIFTQALQLYQTSLRQMQLLLKADGKLQSDILAEATAVRSQADQVWLQGVALLDAERSDYDLDPSGISPPSTPPGAPGGLPGGGTIPGLEGETGGDGAGGRAGGGKGGGKGTGGGGDKGGGGEGDGGG